MRGTAVLRLPTRLLVGARSIWCLCKLARDDRLCQCRQIVSELIGVPVGHDAH
jgi:hypothetical protein